MSWNSESHCFCVICHHSNMFIVVPVKPRCDDYKRKCVPRNLCIFLNWVEDIVLERDSIKKNMWITPGVQCNQKFHHGHHYHCQRNYMFNNTNKKIDRRCDDVDLKTSWSLFFLDLCDTSTIEKTFLVLLVAEITLLNRSQETMIVNT